MIDLERGWPYVAVLTEADVSPAQLKSASKAFARDEVACVPWFVEWPRDAARRFIRDFAKDPFCRAPKLADSKPVTTAELPKYFAAVIAPQGPGRVWLMESVIYLLEAELGPTVVFDALIDRLEQLGRESGIHGWLEAGLVLLLRMTPAEQKARRARLSKWRAALLKLPATPSTHEKSYRRAFRFTLTVAIDGVAPLKDEAAWDASFDQLRAWKGSLRLALKDPKAVLASCATRAGIPNRIIDARLIHLGGEAVVREYLDFQWRDPKDPRESDARKVAHLAAFSWPAAIELLGEFALKSQAKEEALAVLKADAERAVASLEKAKGARAKLFKPLLAKLEA